MGVSVLYLDQFQVFHPFMLEYRSLKKLSTLSIGHNFPIPQGVDWDDIQSSFALHTLSVSTMNPEFFAHIAQQSQTTLKHLIFTYRGAWGLTEHLPLLADTVTTLTLEHEYVDLRPGLAEYSLLTQLSLRWNAYSKDQSLAFFGLGNLHTLMLRAPGKDMRDAIVLSWTGVLCETWSRSIFGLALSKTRRNTIRSGPRGRTRSRRGVSRLSGVMRQRNSTGSSVDLITLPTSVYYLELSII